MAAAEVRVVVPVAVLKEVVRRRREGNQYQEIQSQAMQTHSKVDMAPGLAMARELELVQKLGLAGLLETVLELFHGDCNDGQLLVLEEARAKALGLVLGEGVVVVGVVVGAVEAVEQGLVSVV